MDSIKLVRSSIISAVKCVAACARANFLPPKLLNLAPLPGFHAFNRVVNIPNFPFSFVNLVSLVHVNRRYGISVVL